RLLAKVGSHCRPCLTDDLAHAGGTNARIVPFDFKEVDIKHKISWLKKDLTTRQQGFGGLLAFGYFGVLQRLRPIIGGRQIDNNTVKQTVCRHGLKPGTFARMLGQNALLEHWICERHSESRVAL